MPRNWSTAGAHTQDYVDRCLDRRQSDFEPAGLHYQMLQDGKIKK